MLISWESLAAMVVRISFDILSNAFSCLCPTYFKQNSAWTFPVALYLLVVIKAGHEHPVFQDPCDFIALFPVLLETNVPVLLHRKHDFVKCLVFLSARCFTYQLFVILSSSFFHFSNSVMSSNVMLSIFKSRPWWLLRWCIKSPAVAKADLERQRK